MWKSAIKAGIIIIASFLVFLVSAETLVHFRKRDFGYFCDSVQAGAPVTGFLKSAAKHNFDYFSISEHDTLKRTGWLRKLSQEEISRAEEIAMKLDHAEISVMKVIFIFDRQFCSAELKRGIVKSKRISRID